MQYQVNLLELVRELAHKDHLAVLVALHDLNLAAHYADRIALMVAGEIKAIGKPKEVLLPELIAEAYCLPVQVVPHPFMDIPLVLPDSEKYPIGLGHLLAIIPQPRRKVAVEKAGRWVPIIERNKLIKDNHIGFNTLGVTYARRFVFRPNEDVVKQNLIKDENSFSNAIPEPNQLGFIYRGSQAAIGIE